MPNVVRARSSSTGMGRPRARRVWASAARTADSRCAPERRVAAAGGAVHHRRHGGRDDDEDHQGQRVLRALDGQRALRVGEEPVDDQRRDHGTDDGRQQAADERGRDGQREEQQHLERQLVPSGGGEQAEGDHGDPRGGEQPAAPAPPGSEAVVAETQTLDAAAGVADEVHVDVAGCRGDLLADAASSEPGQPRAAAGADDDLRGVDAAGDVEDRLGDVAPGHLVHHAAELFRPAFVAQQGFPGRRRRDPRVVRRGRRAARRRLRGRRSGRPGAARSRPPARR